MSFDLVPADLVLKVINQLPLKDRVRLSGVNRLFRDISMESIAKMKSLIVNDDLETYSTRVETICSLLESCSPTLQSIDVSSESCPKSFINVLPEFVYPKLEHLQIRVSSENVGQMKMLISRNRNLRSIILHLNCEFEWPKDVAFEKMEKLEIIVWRSGVDLSPILQPLIGKIPNLKHLTIKNGANHPRIIRHTLSALVLSQLLASNPSLEELYLDLLFDDIGKCQDVVTAVPTWRLPKVTTLHFDVNIPNLPSIIQHFPVSFPRLQSFTSTRLQEITDPDITALSQMKYLRELRLPRLIINEDKFLEMINSISSITVLQISKSEGATFQELSQLEHLREFYLMGTIMKKAQIIDLITNVQSITVLGIYYVSTVNSYEKFIDFLSSTAASILRNLEIHMTCMSVSPNNSELRNALEAMKDNGGPIVTYEVKGNSLRIRSISNKSLD